MMLYKGGSNCMKSSSVTTQTNVIEQYVPVVLFV